MSELDGNKAIEQLFAELAQARVAFDAATEAEKDYANKKRDALNLSNGISKRIDAAVRKMRESAPPGTAWSTEQEGSPT